MEDNDILEDDLDVLELVQVGIPRRVYVRSHYYNSYDELAFFKRFRLTKNTVLHLLMHLEEHLEYPFDTNNCVAPMDQFLIALRFYATGNHLQSVADYGGVHVSTACRIIKRVSQAIAHLSQLFIRFPATDEEIAQSQRTFFDIAAFPRVIGAVDGSHIRIQSPGGDDGEVFRNRKDYFSINIQAVSNADMKFMDLVARWPGSGHDATIFNNSSIKRRFETGEFQNCFLLGDSAYAIKPYLMTPLLQPHTPAEQRYNESHIRSRGVVEKLFGIWKRRFPVMAYGCRLKLENTLTVIVATAVLHNIAREMGEIEPPPELEEHVLDQLVAAGQIPNIPPPQAGPGLGPNRGREVRQSLIDEYFGPM